MRQGGTKKESRERQKRYGRRERERKTLLLVVGTVRTQKMILKWKVSMVIVAEVDHKHHL
jgi:ribosomal protein L7Ae-like RNA K-turn-binding protein